MKKTFLFVMVAIMIFASSSVNAENKAGDLSAGLSVGYYSFEGNQDYKNNVALGFRAGYNLTDHWGTEFYYHYIPSEYKDTGSDNEVYVAGIEALYHFMPEKRLVPFVAAGIGAIHYSSDDSALVPSKFTVDYGAGVKYFVTEKLSLRADVRHILPLGESGKYGENPRNIHNDLLATFGITFSFGGGKKETASARAEEAYIPPKPAPAPVVVEPVIQEQIEPVVIEEPAAAEPEASVVEAPVAVPVMSETETAQAVERFTPEQKIEIFVSKWLTSWESGDMETYRNCYTNDFRSKGMNLGAWVAYKKSVRRKSENIKIKIDNLKISADEQTATAKVAFTQYYSSSVLIDKGNKTLSLKKVNEDWKIFRESFVPIK
jgi:outer membrane beta-barrel protein